MENNTDATQTIAIRRLGRGASALALTLIVGLIAAACGSSAATTAPPTGPGTPPLATQAPSGLPIGAPTVAPTAVASPSVALEALAAHYSEVSTNTATALDQCTQDASDLGAGTTTLAAAKLAAGKCLTAYSGIASDFESTDWGPVQPQANEVITAMNAFTALMTTMANAPDAKTFRAAYDQLSATGASLRTAAATMRAALGLPPAASAS